MKQSEREFLKQHNEVAKARMTAIRLNKSLTQKLNNPTFTSDQVDSALGEMIQVILKLVQAKDTLNELAILRMSDKRSESGADKVPASSNEG